MSAISPGFPVAIVGYSYRMPGGIRTDADFWRLLSDREIVQEPVMDRYGPGLPAHRPLLGSGPLREPLRGPDSRGRRKADRSQALRPVPGRDAVNGSPGQDASDLFLGDLRARWLGLSFVTQQSHRHLHRSAGARGSQLETDARGGTVRRHDDQSCHAGESHLLSLQPDGAIHHQLHGVLGEPHCTARGDDRAPFRGLRKSPGRVRELPGHLQAERFIQCPGCHQPRRPMPFLRRRSQRLHPFGGRLHLRPQAA